MRILSKHFSEALVILFFPIKMNPSLKMKKIKIFKNKARKLQKVIQSNKRSLLFAYKSCEFKSLKQIDFYCMLESNCILIIIICLIKYESYQDGFIDVVGVELRSRFWGVHLKVGLINSVNEFQITNRRKILRLLSNLPF